MLSKLNYHVVGYIGIGVPFISYYMEFREQLIEGYILCGRPLIRGALIFYSEYLRCSCKICPLVIYCNRYVNFIFFT